jgi:RNA polymerase sigma-70 factor (ECF subfamily)
MVKGVMAMANLPSGATLDQWISQCAEGNTHALEQLYRATSPAVYAYLLSVLKDTHDAQDLLHETYLNIWTGAAGYRSQSKPMAWILTIGKNLCMRQLRNQSKPSPPPEEWMAYTPDSGEMTQEDRWIIRQCMEQLSEEARQIVVLHAVAGFKHWEIAKFLDLPLSTVLSKYHRSIQKLRAMF